MHAYSESRLATSDKLNLLDSVFLSVKYLLSSVYMIFIDHFLGLSEATHVFFSCEQLHKYLWRLS